MVVAVWGWWAWNHGEGRPRAAQGHRAGQARQGRQVCVLPRAHRQQPADGAQAARHHQAARPSASTRRQRCRARAAGAAARGPVPTGGSARGRAVDAQVSRLANASALMRKHSRMLKLTRLFFNALAYHGLVPVGSQRVVIDRAARHRHGGRRRVHAGQARVGAGRAQNGVWRRPHQRRGHVHAVAARQGQGLPHQPALCAAGGDAAPVSSRRRTRWPSCWPRASTRSRAACSTSTPIFPSSLHYQSGGSDVPPV